MDANASHDKLVNDYLAAYTRFDVSGMVALLDPGIRFENYSNEQLTVATTGIPAFEELATQSATLFSERSQTLQSLRIWPDHAVAMIAFRGKLAKDFPGGPCAGTVIEMQGRSEFSFRDGRITKIVDRA